MSLQTIITEIERLKIELDSYYPIPNDRLQKINYKFRLEWNYHSNKMEGGTLTFEETRSVMMEQLDVRGKPLRDVMEMRGHDEVIKNIQKIGRGEVRITENRIKEIHKAIIFEETDTPGRFKNRNNYIYNYQGERFDFTPQEDTIEATNSLTNWLDNELTAIKKNKSKKTIPEIAFEYHLRFLTIHPFLDGNGRTGRILMNLILISHGYPPIIIRTEEKDLYSKHISHAQQYEENPVPLYEMLGNLLIRSFETCIKGAKGESVFEMEDWEKRLQLLEYQAINKKNVLLKSNDTVYNVLIESALPFIEYAEIKFSIFSNLFLKKNIYIQLDFIEKNYKTFTDLNTLKELREKIHTLKNDEKLDNLEKITITFEWLKFKSIEKFSICFQFVFNIDNYILTHNYLTNTKDIIKNYAEYFKKEEIEHIINSLGSSATDEVEEILNKNK